MTEVGPVSATFAAIKTALIGLKGLKMLGLSAKQAGAVDAAIEVFRDAHDCLKSVHGELIDLRQENRTLRRRIAGHDDWQRRLSAYALVRRLGGAQVYQHGDPPNDHYACPACIENRQIHVLQPVSEESGLFRCPSLSCRELYRVNRSSDPSATNYGEHINPFVV